MILSLFAVLQVASAQDSMPVVTLAEALQRSARLDPNYVVAAGQQMIAHTEELAKHAGGDYSAQHIDYYVKLLKSHGTWLEPTLVTTSSIIQVFDSLDALLASRHQVAGAWTQPDRPAGRGARACGPSRRPP